MTSKTRMLIVAPALALEAELDTDALTTEWLRELPKTHPEPAVARATRAYAYMRGGDYAGISDGTMGRMAAEARAVLEAVREVRERRTALTAGMEELRTIRGRSRKGTDASPEGGAPPEATKGRENAATAHGKVRDVPIGTVVEAATRAYKDAKAKADPADGNPLDRTDEADPLGGVTLKRALDDIAEREGLGSMAEVADKLGVSRSTLYGASKAGTLPPKLREALVSYFAAAGPLAA